LAIKPPVRRRAGRRQGRRPPHSLRTASYQL
jgi:hypothetical protein